MNLENVDQTPSRPPRVLIAIVIAVLLLGLLLFRESVLGWFGAGDATHAEGTASAAELSAETRDELRAALGAYEQVRLLLSADTIEGLPDHASDLAASLRAARERGPAPGDPLSKQLDDATAAAEALGQSPTIDQARTTFGELSAHLIAVVATSSELRSGWYLFSCPMVPDGRNLWLQPSSELDNPFMGQSMATCGSSERWPVSAPSTSPEGGNHLHSGHSPDEVAHWTCPMHPSVKQSREGACPICGMDLLPVSRRDVESGVLLVDESARRRIGVKTAVVREQPVELTIRAVGKTAFDESRLRDVTLKLKGWIERLYVNETGQPVRQGQPLLAVYSPELYAAQQEYLLALRSQRSARASGAPDRADYLVRGARERLRLWDLTDGQIRKIEETGQPVERVPVLSPVTGYVIEKNVVEGAAVEPGQRIYRIASLASIWIEADVYEQDLPQVRLGQRARVTFPYHPGRTLEGKITYVYPYLDPETRTGKIRIELPNPGLELRPEMFANVEILVDRGVRLVVPDSAVIRTGPRELVFLDLGDGRLRPKQVELGARSASGYEVLSGLEPGDVVVTSANFLISSESRLRSAEQVWTDQSDE